MTSIKKKKLFSAPVFKNAIGDQLLITIAHRRLSQYLSSRQIICNWPDAEGVDTSFVVTAGHKEFDLEIKHVVQVAITREQVQHRYILQNHGKIFNICIRFKRS
jgi:hypothetical protein